MASAQVLPNSAASSRKQEHLEAGKRRLDEFRKKKAAKKAASTSQARNSDGQNGKQPSENEHVRANELNGVSTSDGIGGTVIHTSAAGMSNDESLNSFTQSSNQGSVAGITSSARNDLNSFPTITETLTNIDEANRYNASGLTGSIKFSQNEGNQVNDIYTVHAGGAYGTANSENITLNSQETLPFDSNSNLSTLGMNQSHSNNTSSSVNDYTVADQGSYFSSKLSPYSSADMMPQIKPINASTLDSGYLHGALYGGYGDSMSSGLGKTITSSGGFPNLLGATMEKLDSTGSIAGHSSNHIPTYSVPMESSSRRSRPSFLDSLNVARPSSAASYVQPEKDSSSFNHPEPSTIGTSGSTYFPNPSIETKTMVPFSNSAPTSMQSQFDNSTSSSNFNNNGQDILSGSAKENNMEKKHDFYAPTKNEDFAALEQHIEDLTQEKFSLQRALEASQSLAESLAAENSSLTDSYNQQRGIVNQLKSDMERLQEEIKLHLQIELESVRNEYTNAQLECNAADERAKLLASEVISLEDKALRLRSSELKLEKQLENTQAEITSYRKKMSSLEKDRHDLQSTINALQEEKKLLLSKVRKASGIGNSIENSTNKKDVSTSTEDIASTDAAASSSSQEMHDSSMDYSGLSLVPEVGHSTFGASPVNIPPDHMRLIENINALTSELALEKEELLKALASESSECSRMKELNKELSRKLEAQTQRLEFLTAQSMSNDHAPVKQPDVHTTYDNVPYADEGDEVVERVLGWIMKLFPGGPAKRRTSKLN